eukprot:gene8526-4826_t
MGIAVSQPAPTASVQARSKGGAVEEEAVSRRRSHLHPADEEGGIVRSPPRDPRLSMLSNDLSFLLGDAPKPTPSNQTTLSALDHGTKAGSSGRLKLKLPKSDPAIKAIKVEDAPDTPASDTTLSEGPPPPKQDLERESLRNVDGSGQAGADLALDSPSNTVSMSTVKVEAADAPRPTNSAATVSDISPPGNPATSRPSLKSIKVKVKVPGKAEKAAPKPDSAPPASLAAAATKVKKESTSSKDVDAAKVKAEALAILASVTAVGSTPTPAATKPKTVSPPGAPPMSASAASGGTPTPAAAATTKPKTISSPAPSGPPVSAAAAAAAAAALGGPAADHASVGAHAGTSLGARGSTPGTAAAASGGAPTPAAAGTNKPKLVSPPAPSAPPVSAAAAAAAAAALGAPLGATGSAKDPSGVAEVKLKPKIKFKFGGRKLGPPLPPVAGDKRGREGDDGGGDDATKRPKPWK